MDRDAAECGEHPGGVHSLGAAPFVHGDQRVVPGGGGVDPGELPGDPEPGLIEVRHPGGGDRGADRFQRAAERPGDPVTMPLTAPGETGTPNSSAIAWQVRFRDRNCPCHKYAHAAAIRGPYWTGAAAPAGAGAAVTVPHEQCREISRCSVTSARVPGGRSVTCRRSIPACGAPARSPPQPAQLRGSWQITSSGSAVITSVAPGCPFGRPGLRPDFPRSDFGACLARPSDDGGREEFREFAPSRARSSATSARSTSSCSRSTPTSMSLASITCRSRALAARRAAASSGADGTSGTNPK